MAGTTATQEQDVGELEKKFVTHFSSYLIKLSDVSSDFEPGGQTKATPSLTQKAVNAVPSAIGALVPYGRAVVKPLEEAVEKGFNILDRKDKIKIYRILPQKKKDARKIYVDAALKSFRMLEYQFINVVAEGDEDGRRAMAKLAEDAAERVINYVIEEYDDIAKREFHKSENFVFNAILFGDSNRNKIIWKGRTVIFKNCDNGKLSTVNTMDLFETSGYILNEKGTFIHKELEKGSGAGIYGYKRLWPFDEFYKTKESKEKWKEIENVSMQYKYKLAFDEEEVAKRAQEIVKEIEGKESPTKADVEEKVEEGYLKVVEEVQQGNKMLKDIIEDVKDLVSGKNSAIFANGENISGTRHNTNLGQRNVNTQFEKEKIEKEDQLMKKIEDEIKQNLVFLTENLTNLTGVLEYLIQGDIISTAESEDIEAEKTLTEKNFKLLSVLERKDWRRIRNSFLEILRKTKNERCAQAIQGRNDGNSVPHWSFTNAGHTFELQSRNNILHQKINKKWWPEKKLLIKSLLKRKFGEKLLIEELKDRISLDENRMVVIYESAAASKYSGMGGIGKTLTAKWYAHTYEQEYDHIIWIDCGEGSLLSSFESLARDLEIPNRNELIKVQDYSRKCFDALSGFKCLLIYDNAENYKGKEGIQEVLPKYQENFYCIITSRSQDWGTKTGYGKISDLQLDIFSEVESLDFLKCNLDASVEHTESELKELCSLMGNLPLALQLAVAALNNGKIQLQNYIEKTSSKDLESIVDKEFDDYEKTINKSIRISLDMILKEKNGKLAYEVLMIFGYIRPDDIRSLFLMKILNSNSKEMEEAINLLEKYSLIIKTGKVMEFPHEGGFFNKLLGRDKQKIEMDLLSIHRLLQQVIRHNGKKTEKEMLMKILSCDGFLDYKFIPFTKYADEELKKSFPKVRAELLDQRQLRIFIAEERFEESVQLAKFIDRELRTKTTKLNHAVCLYKNGQEEECVDNLKELYLNARIETRKTGMTQILEKMMEYIKTTEIKIKMEINFKLLDLKEEPTKKDIGDPIFWYYLGLEQISDALAIVQNIADETHIIKIQCEILMQRRFEESVQLAKIIVKDLKTKAANFNYAICLAKNQQFEESVVILKELEKKKIIEAVENSKDFMDMGLLKLEKDLSKDLVDIHLFVIQWRIEKGIETRQKFVIHPNVSIEILDILLRIIHSDLIKSNYSLVKDTTRIELKLGGKSNEIKLSCCSVELSSFDPLAPEKLELDRMSFTKNGQELEHVIGNQFDDLKKINRMLLRGRRYNDRNMSIDLSGDICLEYLKLWNVRVLSWEEAKWNIQKLELENVPFEQKTKMTIKEMGLRFTSLDVSCLPQTIQKLDLWATKVACSGEIDLPDLNYLTFGYMADCSFLSSFDSVNITHIHFYGIKEVNVIHLPKSVAQIKITGCIEDTNIIVGERRVKKLILEGFSDKQVKKLLSHFLTDDLVVTPKELIELSKKEMNH